MNFLLKSSGLILILFLFYTIFLQKETYFKSIRHYFLIGLLIAISIPLIEIPIYVKAVASELNNLNFQQVSNTNTIEVKTINWTQILSTIYILGVLFFSAKFLFQLVSLIRLISKHTLIKQGNYYFIETFKNSSPFSFFNLIIYNKSQFSKDELSLIINHEKAHVAQWHSIDTLLTHLLVITLWFNPFVWLYKKAVQQNLEFLADKFAIELAKNKKQYQLTLLKTCNTNFCTAITNNFYNSLIKKRILMLQKSQSQHKKQWKFALLLPLLIAFIATFNTKLIAQEKKLSDLENLDKLKIEYRFDKNATDASLEKEAAFFKKQFDAAISFKSIKRNAKNEITAIKITSKHKSNSSVFIRKSDEPIQPIIISYNSEIDKINIGDAVEEEEEEEEEEEVVKDEIHLIHKNNIKKNKEAKKIWVSKKDNDTLIVNGNKISWHKDEDNHIEVEVIERKYKNDIWFKDFKKDSIKNDYRIEIDSVYFISDEGEQTEIDVDEINASENVYIIKSDEKGQKDKIIKSKIAFNSNNEKPLYIIDGKEVDAKEIENLNPDSLKSMSVLKDESATKKYGKKGENGVIEITTKKKYSTSINTDESAISKNLNRIVDDNNPLTLVNGKEVSTQEMKNIDPKDIKSVEVFKDEKATKKYGEKGKNGVIIITLKKE